MCQELKAVFPSLRLPTAARSGIAAMLGVCLLVCSANGQGLRLRDICRLKGQESNTLHGFGLVVGLKGTGDGDEAGTANNLARVMELLGGPTKLDANGQLDPSIFGDAKNVALVHLTAEVPPVGAQQGDRIRVVVNAINAKSLEGGYLIPSPLRGPQPNDPVVYAMADGRLEIDKTSPPTTASISRGAKIETTIQVPFEKDGRITLIIDQDFADFSTTQRVVEAIDTLPLFIIDQKDSPGMQTRVRYAQAIDQKHVQVLIPTTYRTDHIRFIASIMEAPILLDARPNRVVINEREGIVVVGEGVEIGASAVTHSGMLIEAGGGAAGFREFDPGAPPEGNPKLKALVDGLNALKVANKDIIEIIKAFKAKGDLYGEVIFID